jgi:hypothetical protein
VAEVLILSDNVPEMEPLIQPVCDAAARWLRSGLFEDVWFSKVEFAYHAALLPASRCGAAVFRHATWPY